MELSDLMFGTDFFNRVGRRNISGDELAALLGPGVNAGRGANITAETSPIIPDTTPTALDFGANPQIQFDDLDFVQPGVDQTQFIIPAGVSRVQLWCSFQWDSDATGIRVIVGRKNGAILTLDEGGGVLRQSAQPSGAVEGFLVTGALAAVEGDRFGFGVQQTSGGNLDVDVFGMTITVLR